MYCARRKRGLGEADKDVPKVGVPEVGGVLSALRGASRRGLGMLNGLEGEVIVVRVQERASPDRASSTDSYVSGVHRRPWPSSEQGASQQQPLSATLSSRPLSKPGPVLVWTRPVSSNTLQNRILITRLCSKRVLRFSLTRIRTTPDPPTRPGQLRLPSLSSATVGKRTRPPSGHGSTTTTATAASVS